MTEAKREFKGMKVEEIDGVKIWLSEESWILFRPSSNAPEFRVFAESKEKKEAKKIAEKGMSFVENRIRKK